MHAIRRLVLIAVALAAAGIAMPAQAVPSNTRVDKVFRLPCDDEVCTTTNGDRRVEFGDVLQGSVQIQASSSSQVGLIWVRIDARRDNGDWYCIKQWDLNTTSFSGVFNWNTNAWPGDCPDGLTTETRNGSYDVRVVAKERVSGDQAVSSAFSFDLSNRPTPPRWSGDPSVSGASERNPLVTLSFKKNPEPDVFEYHYVRITPHGNEGEWAVSASKPGGQGCDDDSTTITCYDDEFASSGYGGEYTYALIAYRSSPSSGDSCALSPQPSCVQSSVSEVRSVMVEEPDVEEPATDPTTVAPRTGGTSSNTGGGATVRGGGVRRGSGTSSDPYCYTCGSFDEELPYGQQPYAVQRGSESSANTQMAAALPLDDVTNNREDLWRSVAAGLLLLLAAAHAARVLKRA